MFLWTCKKHFWEPCQNCFGEIRKTFAHKGKNFMKLLFFSNNFFYKMFLWTRRMQFEQPCRKCFAPCPEFFHSKSKIYMNLFFLKTFISSNTFLLTSRMQFWQACLKNFWLKIRKLFAQCQKKFMKLFFSLEFFCSKMFLRTRRMQFWRLCQKLLAQSPIKIQKFWCFIKRLKLFLWTHRIEFCECQFLSNIVLTAIIGDLLTP